MFRLALLRVRGLLTLFALLGAFVIPSATAQTTLFSEDFESYSNNYGFRNGGNSGGYDGTNVEWTLSGDVTTLNGNQDFWCVKRYNDGDDRRFEGRDLDGEFTWTSREINVSGTSLTLRDIRVWSFGVI